MAISREEVLWAYRLILGREPESEKAIQVHLRHDNIASLRANFLSCSEFKKKNSTLASDQRRLHFNRLDLPKISVETTATPAQLALCLAKIKAAWTHLGLSRPHFSVLTNKIYLPENLENNLDNFYTSGENEAARTGRMLERHGVTDLSDKVCVEYGCGVGRVTMGLARRCKYIHGYDISQGHLDLAKQRAKELDIGNCRFHLCSDNLLEPLEKCDFFYSVIVFQHNPPPVIRHLIRNALRALNTGGIAIFQVPTYFFDYHFSIDEWLAATHRLDMQMHCIPQDAVFSIIAEEDCKLLDVREDNRTGSDRFISNTFVVRKL